MMREPGRFDIFEELQDCFSQRHRTFDVCLRVLFFAAFDFAELFRASFAAGSRLLVDAWAAGLVFFATGLAFDFTLAFEGRAFFVPALLRFFDGAGAALAGLLLPLNKSQRSWSSFKSSKPSTGCL